MGRAWMTIGRRHSCKNGYREVHMHNRNVRFRTPQIRISMYAVYPFQFIQCYNKSLSPYSHVANVRSHPACVCVRVRVRVRVPVRSFQPPHASRPQNIGTHVFTATRKTFYLCDFH